MYDVSERERSAEKSAETAYVRQYRRRAVIAENGRGDLRQKKG